MANPVELVLTRRAEVERLRHRLGDRVMVRLSRAQDQVQHLGRQVGALSPQSTLERGYAVVQHRDGRVVVDVEDVEPEELLRVRVARGDFGVRPVTARTAPEPASAMPVTAEPPTGKPVTAEPPTGRPVTAEPPTGRPVTAGPASVGRDPRG